MAIYNYRGNYRVMSHAKAPNLSIAELRQPFVINSEPVQCSQFEVEWSILIPGELNQIPV